MIKSFIVMLILIGTGSSILERSHFKTWTLLKPLTQLGRCQSEELQRGQEEGCPSQGYLGVESPDPGQWNQITCWHLGLEQFEDGCNVLINCRIPEGQPMPKGRKTKQGQHNPVSASDWFWYATKKAHLIFTLLLGSVWGLKVWKIGIEKITRACFFTCALSSTLHIIEIVYPFFVGSRNTSWQ